MFLQLTLCDLHTSVPTLRQVHKNELYSAQVTSRAVHGPPMGRCTPTHLLPARPVAHHEHSSLCAASNYCAMPSENQHGLAVSQSEQIQQLERPRVTWDKNIVTVSRSPSSPNQATNVVCASFPAHKHTHPIPARGSSAIRLSEPYAPASSRSRSFATRTGKYAPPRWGLQGPVTPHVFARRRKLCLARTHSCHHHGCFWVQQQSGRSY